LFNAVPELIAQISNPRLPKAESSDLLALGVYFSCLNLLLATKRLPASGVYVFVPCLGLTTAQGSVLCHRCRVQRGGLRDHYETYAESLQQPLSVLPSHYHAACRENNTGALEEFDKVTLRRQRVKQSLLNPIKTALVPPSTVASS